MGGIQWAAGEKQNVYAVSSPDAGLKYSLATGNWGDRKNAQKAGVSQVRVWCVCVYACVVNVRARARGGKCVRTH